MPHVAMVVEYDGSKFHGWQRQPGLRTIHDELLLAVSRILREEISHIDASGRTDAGVSATAQVVAFQCRRQPDLWRLKAGVSSLLRHDLAVIGAWEVPSDFHPRRCAVGKEYHYRILNRTSPAVLHHGRVWHVARPLSVSFLQRLAQPLVGTHDFGSFRNAGCDAPSTIKSIHQISITATADGMIECRIVGSGFLKQMVRIIIGTIVDIALGRIPGGVREVAASEPELMIEAILAARNRGAAGVTAPPHGLFLHRVLYPPHIAKLFTLDSPAGQNLVE